MTLLNSYTNGHLCHVRNCAHGMSGHYVRYTGGNTGHEAWWYSAFHLSVLPSLHLQKMHLYTLLLCGHCEMCSCCTNSDFESWKIIKYKKRKQANTLNQRMLTSIYFCTVNDSLVFPLLPIKLWYDLCNPRDTTIRVGLWSLIKSLKG